MADYADWSFCQMAFCTHRHEQHTDAHSAGFLTNVSFHKVRSRMTYVGMHADYRSKRLVSGELYHRAAATRLKTKRDGR